jgi:hypothetical protein
MFGLGLQEILILGLVGLVPLVIIIWVVRNFIGGRNTGAQ